MVKLKNDENNVQIKKYKPIILTGYFNILITVCINFTSMFKEITEKKKKLFSIKLKK
jgi:hypothetical protein